MKKHEVLEKTNLEVTWIKLESSLFNYTPQEAKKKRPASGKPNHRKVFSQDIQARLSGTVRASKKQSTSQDFDSLVKETKQLKSLSSENDSTISQLTSSEIRSLYEAKCLDLGIQPFGEQEKRFNGYCLHHFYNRNFDMVESGLGLESAKAIGLVLQNSPHFAYLRLGKNNLGDEGCVEIVKNIYKNSALVHIDFSSNELSFLGVREMCEYLCRNESLISVDFSSHKGLNRNRIGPKGAESLAEFLRTSKILQFLNIAGAGIGAEGLKNLIPGIISSKNLLSLNLSSNGLGWEYIEDLGRGVLASKITRLELGNNNLGLEGALAVAGMLMGHDNRACTVEYLNISCNSFNTKGISKILYSLTNNNTLNYLDLSENDFSAGLSTNFPLFLIENSGVKVLNLSKCRIKSLALSSGFPEALSKNRFLKDLNLSKNKICDIGAELICSGLGRNLGLKKLDLSGNFIKEKGGKALAGCLKTNHVLEELNLKENNINDFAGQQLDDTSRKNRNLTGINLDLNSVALSFVFNIRHNLKKNQHEKKKKVVPELKGRIKYLSQNSEKLDKVKNDLENRQNEFTELFKRVEKNSERMNVIRLEETRKNEVVHNEYLRFKGLNEKVSEEYEEVLYEMTVKLNRKSSTMKKKRLIR